ncbi:MAG TPA: hypothetical protein VFD30_09710 [Terriglobia bacterium]|jgi:hypothetical protein|nr:hypothetical protein [Terriglobia bacterium]
MAEGAKVPTLVHPGGLAALSHRQEGAAQPSRPQPWILPAQGLAVFHGDAKTARLSHYFLPRLLLEGKRVLLLDGANSADPRLLERLARQRRVPFEQFNQQVRIARAFTCFQLTELIARVPQFLADFPAEVLIVTAFPELYYDEDVRDWNARVAFEQALADLRWLARYTGGVGPLTRPFGPPSPQGRGPRAYVLSPSPCGRGAGDEGTAETCDATSRAVTPPLRVAVFSSASTYLPSPARRRFFEKTCGIAREVWKFSVGGDGRLGLACTRQPNHLITQ